MLVQRLRRQPNIKLTLGERLMLAEPASHIKPLLHVIMVFRRKFSTDNAPIITFPLRARGFYH